MSDTYKIGPWVFTPQIGTLVREADTRRLEHRAARVLEVLCTHGGDLVTHDALIEQVWDGRATSANSVAVVVADIRKALGDAARQPIYIETVPKRGYRLISTPEAAEGEARAPHPPPVLSTPGRWIAAGLVGALLLAIAWWQMQAAPTSAPLVLSVAPIEDQTGDTQYSDLVPAVSDLIAVEVMRHDAVTLVPPGNEDYRLSGRLIIWDGRPAVSLMATNDSGETVWSGMASGPESALPRQVRREIGKFMATRNAEDPTR